MEYTVFLKTAPAHYIMMQTEADAKLIVERSAQFEMAFDGTYFKDHLAEDVVGNLDGGALLIHRDRLRGYIHQRRALVENPDDDWLLERALEVEIFLAKRAKDCRHRERFDDLRQYLTDWNGKDVRAVEKALHEYYRLAGKVGESPDEAVIFRKLRANRRGWKGGLPDPSDVYLVAADADGNCLVLDHEREFFVVPIEKLRS